MTIRGFHGPAWLWLGGNKICSCLADFATVNTLGTCHGAPPGPRPAPWSKRGPLACPAAESAIKFPLPEQKRYVRVPHNREIHT